MSGGIPASRILRRRVAGEEMGADDGDAFWTGAPRLYDFSQQPQPARPPSPSPEPKPCLLPRPPSPPAARSRSPSPEPKPCGPCPLPRPPSPPTARSRSPSPEPTPCIPCQLPLLPSSPPAARRSPSPEPKPKPSSPCLLTLQSGGVGWGLKKHVQYSRRHRAVCAPPQAVVEEMERRAAALCGDGDDDEESSSGAKKRKRVDEVGKEKKAAAAAAKESSPEDKPVVVKTAKTRNRKRSRTGRRRGRVAARRAKKVPRVKKEEDDDEDRSAGKKRKRPKHEDEEEAAAPAAQGSSRDKPEMVKMETTSGGHGRRRDAAKRAKKIIPPKNEEESEEESKPSALAPKRDKVDRWAARRYAAAEASLLGILRARGATAGRPLPRGDLRAEARRHIGDTGLLDHLLRHVADKVPAGSAERLRRRYNAAGALEYWLEPAGLAAVRREAGVADPYWVPPPGWKPGDPVSPEACSLEMKKQVEELAGEVAAVKRHMKELSSNMIQVSKESYISWQGYDCMMKANANLEKEVLSLEEKYDNATQVNIDLREELLFLKENCESMAQKNAKLEEQMVALSTWFQFLKEELFLQNTGGGEPHVLMLEKADPCVQALPRADIHKQEASAGNALADAAAGVSNAAIAAEKRALRKCSMRICKPQGTFQWLNTATGEACSPSVMPEPLTPGGDLMATNFDAVIYNLAPLSVEEYLTAGGLPTPTSASSSNAASAKLPLAPTPASPVQVQPPPLLEAGKTAMMLDAGAGSVGTELALATSSY